MFIGRHLRSRWLAPCLRPALPDTVDEVMTLVYKQAMRPDGTIDLTKVPTAKELYEAVGAHWDPAAWGPGKGGWIGARTSANMQNHHAAVISWTEKLINRTLTQAEKDSMPAIMLRKIDHSSKTGSGGFHEILRKQPLEDGKPPGFYSNPYILESLQKAYIKWDGEEGPQVWAAAREWLKNMGVP